MHIIYSYYVAYVLYIWKWQTRLYYIQVFSHIEVLEVYQHFDNKTETENLSPAMRERKVTFNSINYYIYIYLDFWCVVCLLTARPTQLQR